ncbi:MAG: O-antigen ligase family protein [Oscillospiraceae bacterium]|nr:O-antigen ligase family protein [Oscillospiraceae bacterium]
MGHRIANKDDSSVSGAVICIVLGMLFAALGWLAFVQIGYKYITLAAGAGMIALLCLGDIRRLGKLPSLLLLAHSAFTMLTIFWAYSGKFFLGRYATTFVASFFLLYAILRGKGNHVFARRAMSITAIVSTIYAVLGVEAVSSGHFFAFAQKIAGDATPDMHGGARLYGVFGNCNIEASFYAIGIIFCVALICAAEKKILRALWAAALACNAYAMLLGISIGAIACFGVAIIVYILMAHKYRGAALLRMMLGALCAVAGVLAFISPLGSTSAGMEFYIMLAIAAAAVVIELLLGERLSVVLSASEKPAIITASAVLVLAIAYLAVGMSISGPETFTENRKSIQRSVVLSAGEQTALIDFDGKIKLTVTSKTPEQVMTKQSDTLFSGTADELNDSKLEVPAGSTSCTITFSGDPGAELRSVVIGGKRVALHYTILPEFIGRRLVALSGSYSLQQRLTYLRDGLKLFAMSPLVGLGDGAFESSITSVQSYEYEAVHSHNQYMESLIEGGIIGFTLFTAGVVATGIVLFKARGKMRGGAYAPFYGALCAEFIMSALQMLWDVSMFVMAFICMIYTLYGIVAAACAEPLTLKKSEPEDGEDRPEPYRKRERPAKGDTLFALRAACCVLPLLFTVSVGLNIYAHGLMNRQSASLGEFLGNLESAAKIDLYEKNDAKLSYVRAVMEYDELGSYRQQADKYAEQLAKVRSNAIPYYLVVYYLNTQRYIEAIDEAKTAASLSASNSDTWNNCVDAMKQVFIDSGNRSPLLDTGGDTLLRKLQEYQGMLEVRNAEKLKPIKLNKNSKAFFRVLAKLVECNGDKEAMLGILTSEG